jgi:tetratricopeptide (TPR) repeat protein
VADAEPEAGPVMEAAAPVEANVPELTLAEQASAEPEPLEPVAPAQEAAVPQAPDVSKLSRLSERLAADRRAKEAEIEARFAQQRAEQEEARRLVWESMQAKKAAVEAAIEALEQPPASEPEPAASTATPEPEPPAVMPTRARTGPLTMPVPRRSTQPLRPVPDDSAWVPATPPRKPTVVSRYAGQAAETVLAEAQAHLQQRDESSAAAALDHLVATGQMTDAVLVELEGAAGATASVPLLRVLGDAYARSNRLEQALETYRQALRRL